MADKAYVEIAPTVIKEIFDNQYKAAVTKKVDESFTKAIDKSSKLTTKTEAKEGFFLTGGVTIKQSKTGLEATLKMAIAILPGKSIKFTATGEASMEIDGKMRKDDVDVLVDAMLKDVQPKIISELEKRVP